jgi:polar amino acid transport system permease protein
MVYPAQIFLFVGLVYLVLCGAFQWAVTRLLAGTFDAGGQTRSR